MASNIIRTGNPACDHANLDVARVGYRKAWQCACGFLLMTDVVLWTKVPA